MIYAQRLLDQLGHSEHKIHVVLSSYAQTVIQQELSGGLALAEGVEKHSLKSMNAPFASGSNVPEAMVVVPCTMGTLGRIAHGYSDNVLLRAADVMLKEKRKLKKVPNETVNEKVPKTKVPQKVPKNRFSKNDLNKPASE